MLTEAQKQRKRELSRARYAANPTVRAAHKAQARRWNEENPERRREIHLEWRKNNPDRFRELSRKAARKRLGIPEPTRSKPITCECCGGQMGKIHDTRAVVDHDHTTGKFRGWLCNRCNLAIGRLGDNIAGIKRALAYLIRAEEATDE
jgi:hypothetical protein